MMTRADKPGVRERARVALDVFRNGFPRKAQRQSSGFPLIWPVWRQGQPVWKTVDYDNFVDEGFNLNALIYEAIMYKVRAKWTAPLKAWKGDRENPERLPEQHPLAQLVARPNPYQSMEDLEAQLVTFLNLAGNAYVMLKRPRGGGMPEAMYTVRPNRVQIVPHPDYDRRAILGYLYVPEGQSYQSGIPIRAEDMMHVKLPNPKDDLDGLGYGMSPIPALARSADVDNAITHFLKLFFDRGTMISGMLSVDAILDDTTIARVKERWSDIYGGYENWTELFVADHNARFERVGMTFDEMGFSQLDERNETRVLGPFGVPAVLVGARVGLQNATYANVNGLRRVFWEDTFKPELQLFENEYRYYLQSDDDAWVAYDYSQVPALQPDRAALTEAAYKMWSMGTPANQAFAAVGLQVEDVPGGDTGYVPMALIPAGTSPPTPALPSLEPQPQPAPRPQREPPDSEEAPPEAEEDEDRGGKAQMFWEARAQVARGNGGPAKKASRGFSPVAKERIWKAVDGIATSWEGKFEEAVERTLRRQQRELLAAVTKESRGALERKATVNWQNVQYDWDQYFDQFADEEWRDEFMPLIKGVVADQGEQWAVTLGMEWTSRNLMGEAWFQDYTLTFAQPINETTSAEIHQMVSQAMAEGWSIPQMETQLGLTFDRWLEPDFTLDGRKLTEDEVKWFTDRSPRYRRELIARTESMRSSSHGSFNLFKSWGLNQHEWLASLDNRTRASHAAANGQVRNVGMPFDVGGFPMLHPHDMSQGAPLGEVANCRCVAIPTGL